jgi:hypothetical protein
MAALVLHQESPMETAITAGTTAALSCAARALASETRRLRCPIRIIAWVARLAMSRVGGEDVHRERVSHESPEQGAGERHGGNGEKEHEVPRIQTFLVVTDQPEYPSVHEPELGDDVERDPVADQLRRVLAELSGQVCRRVRVGQLARGRQPDLQDQQGKGDGDHAVGQLEQAVRPAAHLRAG